MDMDKCYKKSITDSEPTEPYLKCSNPVVMEQNADYPSVRFELTIVLDEGEDIYPKKEFKQLFELGYRGLITFGII
ncbi:hypothetical protein [Ursidibacter maritimus]|nr:hypothetical protein [Ursidibacter maritimus]